MFFLKNDNTQTCKHVLACPENIHDQTFAFKTTTLMLLCLQLIHLLVIQFLVSKIHVANGTVLFFFFFTVFGFISTFAISPSTFSQKLQMVTSCPGKCISIDVSPVKYSDAFCHDYKSMNIYCVGIYWSSMGWLGAAKVSCILRNWGVQQLLILVYSWARPAILQAGMGTGGMFLFFVHFHSFPFSPVPISSLLHVSLFSLCLGDDKK